MLSVTDDNGATCKLQPYQLSSGSHQLSCIPTHRLKFGSYPTPLQSWTFSWKNRNYIFLIKRDDLTDMVASGNKIRKLEFILPEVLLCGTHDYILSFGPCQSNSCRVVTAIAPRIGLKSAHVLVETSENKSGFTEGNLFFHNIFGSELFLMATLNYSRAINSHSDPWYIDTITCPDGIKKCNFEDHAVTVLITDLRGQENFASLDKTGFQTLVAPLSLHPSLFLSGSDDLIATLYYPEMEFILQKITGADKIIIFDHTFRRNNPDCPESPLKREPMLRVHVDQSPKSAHDIIFHHVEEKCRAFKRFQIINVWRPIGNVVYDFPLAVADFRSVDIDEDLVATELRYPSWLKDKETFAVKHNPRHKWYYWSHMNPCEVLLIKCYDSVSSKLVHREKTFALVDENLLQDVAGLAPHTAFFNERDAALNIKRQSIEIRAIVLHL